MAKNKQTTQDAKAALYVKLRTALDEARMAGLAAVREFLKTAEMNADGSIRDTCGYAYLKAGNPSISFRSALRRLDPEAEAWQGYWWILSFGGDDDMPIPASQSIRAHEVACEASRGVMKRHFPEENFYVLSRMD
jgi:hypothetical protein